MTRWTKVRTIAAFELKTTVQRLGFLLATLGMPLLMAAYGLFGAYLSHKAAQRSADAQTLGVVDAAAILDLQGEVVTLASADSPQGTVFRPFSTAAEARTALLDDTVQGYFVVPADYLERGRVELYGVNATDFSGASHKRFFGELVRGQLVAGKIDDGARARVAKPIVDAEEFTLSKDGSVHPGGDSATAIRFAVPGIFTFMFLLSILMTSGYLIRGTAIEKENKVVEVLLAAATPEEILAGKLIGLGAAGMLQILVWIAFSMVGGLAIVPIVLSSGVDVPWLGLVLSVPLFLGAFLFYGALILGTGSLGSNAREAQQLSMVWSLLAALPMMMLVELIPFPEGTLSKVMTWVPLTSGQVIVLRASIAPESLPWWEVVGPIVLLAASTWGALRLGARLFRIGLLSSGSRPTLREILRQARSLS